MISVISIGAQVVVKTTVWAFIFDVEHTKTKGGGTEKYTNQMGRPERTCP